MSNIDNHLVNQKNRILTLINERQFKKALDLLEFVEAVWRSLDYGYKVIEICDRVLRSDGVTESNAAYAKAIRAKAE